MRASLRSGPGATVSGQGRAPRSPPSFPRALCSRAPLSLPFPCTQFLKQLARDALWSDPRVEDGYDVNHRGAGVLFGPDRTRAFLKTNNLKMIVRYVIYT